MLFEDKQENATLCGEHALLQFGHIVRNARGQRFEVFVVFLVVQWIRGYTLKL